MSNNEKRFLKACSSGHTNVVERLLYRGVNINCTNEKGESALIKAISHTDIVKILINKGIDIRYKDKRGETALFHAIRKSNIKSVELLVCDIDLQNSNGETALIVASKDLDFGIVDLLIKKGANLNIQCSAGKTALLYAAQNGDNDFVELLKNSDLNIQDEKGNTALMNAAINGFSRIVSKLLQYGADKHKENNAENSAEDMAIFSGNVYSQIYLNKNAVNNKDANGNTLLIKACRERDEDLVFFLIDNGADLYLENNEGETALMALNNTDKSFMFADIISYNRLIRDEDLTDKLQALKEKLMLEETLEDDFSMPSLNKIKLFDALRRGDVEEFFTLIDKVDDVNYVIDDESLLEIASLRGQLKIVELLIQKGADIVKFGSSAIMSAKHNHHNGVIKFLINSGSDFKFKDHRGHSLLMASCMDKSEDLILFLYERGDNFFIENEIGDSPFKVLNSYTNPSDSLRALIEVISLSNSVECEQETCFSLL